MGPHEPGFSGSVTRDPHEAYLADLAGYVFGVLGPDEIEAVEQHLRTCDICTTELPLLRAAVVSLDEVPPEAFIDGPPEGAELLVRRTMRRLDVVGAETRDRRWRAMAIGASVAAAAIVAGVLIGRETAPQHTAGGPVVVSTPPSPTASAVPGTVTVSHADVTTGARLTGSITPALGWVRVSVAVTGISEGQRCVLYVVPKHGPPIQAGSWVVSAAGAQSGTPLQGTALVPIDQVAALRVSNTAGHVFVTAPA